MPIIFTPVNDCLFTEPDLPRPAPLRELPVGTYNIVFHPAYGYGLKPIDHMALPTKLYGSLGRYADRILSTFGARSAATGVLAVGEKGSGKSLLAKLLSARLRDANISTLVCNSEFCGDKFNTFIQSIEQPAMVLFDEFEKTYHERTEQQKLLTLLDGTFPTKKLFMLTVNDALAVNSHMLNRPGRLYYSLKFTGLEESAIRDYAMDTLANKEHMDDLLMVASSFQSLNFDMLKAIIEEMNRYQDTASNVIKMLNATPANEFGTDPSFTVSVVKDSNPGLIMHPEDSMTRHVPGTRGQTYYANFHDNSETRYIVNDISSYLHGDDIEESDDNFAVLAEAKKLKKVVGRRVFLELERKHFCREESRKGTLVFKKDGYTVTFKPWVSRSAAAYYD